MLRKYQKTFCLLVIILLLHVAGICQSTLVSYSLPKNTQNIHDYNLFILKSSISWACEMSLSYSVDEKSNSNFDIIHYLVNAQRSGKIKSYLDFDVDKKWMKTKRTEYYTEIDKSYFSKEDLPKKLSNTIQFHEIFFIKNHQLKSHIVAAGPEYNVFTQLGINLGHTVVAYSGINYYPNRPNAQNDKIISLGNNYTLLHFDSLETEIGIKKIYGMSLTTNIWYDLSKGFNKVVDLRNNEIIKPEKINEYPIDNNVVSVPVFDSVGNITGSKNLTAATVQPYFYSTGISQKMYYNLSKDFFYSVIDYIDIYIKFYSVEKSEEIIEKRFRVFF